MRSLTLNDRKKSYCIPDSMVNISTFSPGFLDVIHIIMVVNTPIDSINHTWIQHQSLPASSFDRPACSRWVPHRWDWSDCTCDKLDQGFCARVLEVGAGTSPLKQSKKWILYDWNFMYPKIYLEVGWRNDQIILETFGNYNYFSVKTCDWGVELHFLSSITSNSHHRHEIRSPRELQGRLVTSLQFTQSAPSAR